MSKFLPFIVTAVVMIPMVGYQWIKMDWVWGASVPAQQCAYLIMHDDKGVPMVLGENGEWVGEDVPVDPKILEVAGAEGYIQRTYTHQLTNDQVSVWFIVGNFRQISRHTPNACYAASGFQQLEDVTKQRPDVGVTPAPEFFTSKFHKETQEGFPIFQRVFWGWWKPEELKEGESVEDIEIAWKAPEDARVEFGHCRALYKLYFTANTNEDELPDESVCVDFARVFLPEVHKFLPQSSLVIAEEKLPEDFEKVTKILKTDDATSLETQPVTDEDQAVEEAATAETAAT